VPRLLQMPRAPVVKRALLDGSLWLAVLAVVILTALVVATFAFAEAQRQDSATVSRTLVVQMQLSNVLSLMEDAETGQRGFLLTGDQSYLLPYTHATEAMPLALAGLKQDIRDPGQLAALERLRLVIGVASEKLIAGLAVRRAGDVQSAARWMQTNQSRDLMDRIRQEVAAMSIIQENLLVTRNRAAARSVFGLQLVLIAGFAMLIFMAIVVVRQNVLRLRAVIASRQDMEGAYAEVLAEGVHRQAAEAQVRQMQKTEALGQLTGGIAHDFNNMLSVIVGSLDLARRRMTTDVARAQAYIDQALDAAQRAASLTARLLAFARAQPLSPAPCDPNSLVGGMSELLRQTLGEDTRLETVLAGGVWGVFIDPSQLENAILNLCVNARDAMADGGRLTIDTSNAHLDDAYVLENPEVTAGQYVVICVTDTGAGMPADVAARAFDPFFTTKEVGRGTGLGLSQVYGFMKQSGGHVKIYSEVERGTTIKLYLPRWMGAAAPATAARPKPGRLEARHNEVVLVAEDDPRVRAITVSDLEEFGYTVRQAANGQEALDLLDGTVDLLFTDMVMPGMDGPQLAEEAVRRRPKLKVLFTTGYARNALIHNGALAGGAPVLPKPFTIDQLGVKVAEVLAAA
jgi:signal transduction histidine kinase/CheY-like chemotaxis protein